MCVCVFSRSSPGESLFTPVNYDKRGKEVMLCWLSWSRASPGLVKSGQS